jgi:hypothetical protein
MFWQSILTRIPVYLCEVTYAKGLGALLRRLAAWNTHWPEIKGSLVRDNKIFPDWFVTPWLFVPAAFQSIATTKIKTFKLIPGETSPMPFPKVTALESIVPGTLTDGARNARNIDPTPAIL